MTESLLSPATRTSDVTSLARAFSKLTETTDLSEVKSIRDKAESVRKYAQNARLGLELQNQAAELKIRAERKAGSLIKSLKLRGGNRRSKSHCETLKTLTLEDLGVGKHQSSRWQQIASIQEEDFEAWLSERKAANKELTSASLLRLANGRRNLPERESRRSVDSSGPLANIRELQNHVDTFERVLSNMDDSNGVATLKTVEHRLLRRLIREFGELLAAVEKSVEASTP